MSKNTENKFQTSSGKGVNAALQCFLFIYKEYLSKSHLSCFSTSLLRKCKLHCSYRKMVLASAFLATDPKPRNSMTSAITTVDANTRNCPITHFSDPRIRTIKLSGRYSEDQRTEPKSSEQPPRLSRRCRIGPERKRRSWRTEFGSGPALQDNVPTA